MSRTAGLKVCLASDLQTGSQFAAQIILKALQRQPDLILCAAAGGSPTHTYKLLGEDAARERRKFAEMRVIQVDEWLGLTRDDPASCESDLRVKLLEPLGVPKRHFIGFCTDARNAQSECARISGWLARNGPIDISVLGIGANGHIAMNEPGPELRPFAHVARLSRVSLQHPMLNQCRIKPSHGLTLGIAEILQSRQILLLAFGRHKQPVLKRLFDAKVTSRFPGSLLWLHADVTVICDPEAAGSIADMMEKHKL